MQLLEGIGLRFHRTPRLDIAACADLPVTIVFLPAADIAKYVGQGSVHMGITGKDMIFESQVEVTEVASLGFGQCKLGLQAPISAHIKDPMVHPHLPFPSFLLSFFYSFFLSLSFVVSLKD